MHCRQASFEFSLQTLLHIFLFSQVSVKKKEKSPFVQFIPSELIEWMIGILIEAISGMVGLVERRLSGRMCKIQF